MRSINAKLPILIYSTDWNIGLETYSRDIYLSIYELQQQNDPLISNYNFSIHVHGPYVMEICDPVRKVAIEIDNQCHTYNKWSRFYVYQYLKSRHNHLTNEGYQIVHLPMEWLNLDPSSKLKLVCN